MGWRAGGIALSLLITLALASPAGAIPDRPRASTHLNAPSGPTPINRLLRLIDLPAGYDVESDWAGPNGSCNEGPAAAGHHRVACEIAFSDSWRPKGVSRPWEIESAALRFDDAAAAIAAFEARSELVVETFDDLDAPEMDRRPDFPIGDDARLWSLDDWNTGAVVVWRWMHVIGALRVEGSSREVNERAALRYAARQQDRVSQLTPIGPTDNDDSEVALNAPRLPVPVRWLGRHFEPGGGLAPIDIYESSWTEPGDEGPGWSADMTYANRDGGVQISLFRPRAWKRYKRSIIGDRLFGLSCGKPKRVKLEGGKAAVYSTPDWPARRCRNSNRAFFGVAHFRNVVVGVDLTHCVTCVDGRTWGVFNHPNAVAAVLRGLRPRRKQ